MKRLAIIGAGDLGVQLAHHARASGQFAVTGFYDDTRAVGTVVAGTPLLGRIDDIEQSHRAGAFDSLLVGIGYNHLAFRQAVFERFEGRIPFATLIHASAIVDPTCSVEPGAVIYPGCVLDMEVVIGRNALLNAGCVIAHHSRIGAGCFLSPAVKLAGFVTVERQSTLGIGTVVIDHVTIGSGVRTGAGTVVIGDLAQPGLYVGVPARLKKEAQTP